MGEFTIPEPKKLAPNLTSEQRAAMAPLDLLVQFVMPKLLDRQNYLEWVVKKELHEMSEDLLDLAKTVGERMTAIERRLDEVSKPVAKPARKKKESPRAAQAAGVKADTSGPVNWSVIADYDPDTDTWKPKVFDGVAVTASVVREVLENEGAAYPLAVSAMVYDLTADERLALCDAFPA